MAQRFKNPLKSWDISADEIVDDLTELYSQSPSASSNIQVAALSASTVTLTTQPTTDASTGQTVNVLTINANGTIGKKAKSNTKVYKALLVQTGTSAPVATVLENTFGGTLVWTRNSAGWYTVTLASAFTAGKTIVNNQVTFTGNATMIGALGNLSGTLWYYSFDTYGAPNAISLNIYDSAFAGMIELSTAMGVSPLYVEIVSYV